MIGSSGMAFNAFFERPGVLAVRMAMAVRGKKSTAMFPEPWPKPFLVRLRDPELRERFAFEEGEAAFTVHGWKRVEALFHFKKKHQPMGLSLISVFADEAG
jgi:hypothetical protein